ncbi:MAG: hypothetical protein PHU14_10045 [Methylovulum sp.]|nr:hypothetical protein [Methylovulum sp.]
MNPVKFLSIRLDGGLFLKATLLARGIGGCRIVGRLPQSQSSYALKPVHTCERMGLAWASKIGIAGRIRRIKTLRAETKKSAGRVAGRIF